MNNIKLLVVDDNRTFCELVGDYVKMHKDIIFCGASHNGLNALEKIKKHKPDVVLLDNVMPELDGIGVLKQLKNEELLHKPKIILVSACPTEEFLINAYKLGANYVMSHKNDINDMIDRCRMVINTKTVDSIQFENKSLTETISATLRKIGIPANVNGYRYLVEALTYSVENNRAVEMITKGLYPVIAKKFDKPTISVERDIRTAIKISWRRGDLESLAEIFGYNVTRETPKPSNSEFIATLLENIK